MTLPLADHLARFWRDGGSPPSLLLAVSGGSDSIALLLGWLAAQCHIHIPLAVAHVDHKWRAESGAEARSVADLCKRHGVAFYLKELVPPERTGNLEEWGRQERLAFFRQLVAEHGFGALVLGHQREDGVETILKRVLEGSHLVNVKGMMPISTYEEMTIWRPLLPFAKADLRHWLAERSTGYFDDPTNTDARFLRGRLRSQVLPLLSDTYGKQVGRALLQVAGECALLDSYLKSVLEPMVGRVQKGCFGTYFDTSSLVPLHPFLLHHLVRRIALDAGYSLGRRELEQLALWLGDQEPPRRLVRKEGLVMVDRGYLFLAPSVPYMDRVSPLQIKEGIASCSIWRVAMQQVSQEEPIFYPSWKEVWRGAFAIEVPIHASYIAASDPKMILAGHKRSLDRWWTACRVPAWLRAVAPVILNDNGVVADCLSGKRMSPAVCLGKRWRLSFTLDLS